jgi:hypothetical protein
MRYRNSPIKIKCDRFFCFVLFCFGLQRQRYYFAGCPYYKPRVPILRKKKVRYQVYPGNSRRDMPLLCLRGIEGGSDDQHRRLYSKIQVTNCEGFSTRSFYSPSNSVGDHWIAESWRGRSIATLDYGVWVINFFLRLQLSLPNDHLPVLQNRNLSRLPHIVKSSFKSLRAPFPVPFSALKYTSWCGEA